MTGEADIQFPDPRNVLPTGPPLPGCLDFCKYPLLFGIEGYIV